MANIVKVYENAVCGTEIVQIAERALETGCDYTTVSAPVRAGWVFTHWTISTGQELLARDDWGRARDEVSYTLYENTTLTANYLSALQDEDGDGVADGHELYWYGDLSQGATSDTDGDGLSFAEEIARGTSPLMANGKVKGPVKYADSQLLQYNPQGLPPYTIRCEPEGSLFATVTDYVRAGDILSSAQVGAFGANTAGFAYWKLDGVIQRDEWGRALDRLDLTMPPNAVELVAVVVADEETRQKIYWYGTADVAMTSDTDGDGLSFAEEIARGTSPLMANGKVKGPVKYADSQLHEPNLQPYEQVTGAVVGDRYETFPVFDGAVTPMAADVNGDGKFDLVVEVNGGETVVYLGCGSDGNPEFTKVAWQPGWAAAIAAARPRSLDGLAFDVRPPSDALSWSFADVDGDGVEDLLVSDAEGRIWYYRGATRETDPGQTDYKLLHKVWGGSFAGFAEELKIATVDWDGDGDIDCLCGTADGRLALLRDPKIGRPTNLRAEAGVDNVLLTWDPNMQSRVKEYKIYRQATGEDGETVIATQPLPTYRDYPPETTDYDYAVSAISRRYVTGSSRPVTSESPKTMAVRAELGKVTLRWNDATGFDNEEIAVSLGIENSLNVSGEGLAVSIAYDPAMVSPVRVETSGLTENETVESAFGDGVWTISAAGDEIAAGGGTLFTFVFAPVASGTTAVALTSAAMKSVRDTAISVVKPMADAQVTILPFVEPEPVHATVTISDSVEVKAGESFVLSVSVAGEGVDVSSLAYSYVFDETLLSRSGDTFTAAEVQQAGVTAISLTNVTVRASDGSAAVIDSVGVCAVAISPKAGGEDDSGDDDSAPDIVLDAYGRIADWGKIPGLLDPDFRFARRLAGVRLGFADGETGDVVDVAVEICNEDVISCGLLKETTVDVRRWAFEVRYDERLLKPVGLEPEIGDYSWSATNGVLTVTGKEGVIELGKRLAHWKEPLKLRFELLTQYAEHKATLAFGAVQARTTDNRRVYTPIRGEGGVTISFVRPPDDATVVAPYGRGDLNGDGRLTKEDRQLLAKLMNGNKPKWDAHQLKAGDYNGNGRLDQNDYQLLKDDFKAKGIK